MFHIVLFSQAQNTDEYRFVIITNLYCVMSFRQIDVD